MCLKKFISSVFLTSSHFLYESLRWKGRFTLLSRFIYFFISFVLVSDSNLDILDSSTNISHKCDILNNFLFPFNTKWCGTQYLLALKLKRCFLVFFCLFCPFRKSTSWQSSLSFSLKIHRNHITSPKLLFN